MLMLAVADHVMMFYDDHDDDVDDDFSLQKAIHTVQKRSHFNFWHSFVIARTLWGEFTVLLHVTFWVSSWISRDCFAEGEGRGRKDRKEKGVT